MKFTAALFTIKRIRKMKIYKKILEIGESHDLLKLIFDWDINLVTNTARISVLLSSDRLLTSNFSIIVIRETRKSRGCRGLALSRVGWKSPRYVKPAETFFAKLRFQYYSDYCRLTPDQEQLQCRVKTIVRLISTDVHLHLSDFNFFDWHQLEKSLKYFFRNFLNILTISALDFFATLSLGVLILIINFCRSHIFLALFQIWMNNVLLQF